MRSFLPDRRWQQAALLACAVAAALHQWARWDWLIDDAAICFAFARNVANGDGFVPVPGGERVEGVSDPTWTALLVAGQWLGLSGFVTAKPLALGFTLASLPVVWRTARLALPDDDGTASLAAPFALACSSQLAIWSASGLENGLWCFLLACALLATVADARSGAFVRSATAWLLVAWTRPEGIVYAALGGAWWLLWLVRAGHRPLRPTAAWLLWFFVPTAALYGLRYWYFAWPVSNTWYAKVGVRPTHPFAWNMRGWSQLREWAARLWYGWYLPVYQLALVGHRGRASTVTFGCSAVLLLLFAWPGPDALAALWFWPSLPAPPTGYLQLRMGLLVAAGLVYPFAALRRPGADVVGLCWASGVLTLLFSVYADGDWMGAYRWMSLLAPNAAVLFAVGLDEAHRWLRRVLPEDGGRAARVATALVGCGIVPPNLSQTRDHALHNQNETPDMVKYRVDFTQGLVRKTFWEGPVENLDMDMGAHLYWAPEYFELDMAGLVNVPMSRHWYDQTAFVEEYVFGEHAPTFAHVHGWWAKESRLKTYDGWEASMVPVGPYPDQPPLPPHVGVFANRALFTEPEWPHGDGRRVPFEGGLVLEGVHVPVPTWAPGGEGYLELGWTRALPREFRVVAFLSRDATLVTRDLPVGYGEFPVSAWRADREVFVGRYAFPVPAGLAPGPWALGLVVFDEDGHVLAPPPSVVSRPGLVVARGNDASLAEGELRFPDLVTLGTPADVDALEAAAMADVLRRAEALDCDGAEARFVDAKRTHPRDWERHPALRDAVAAPLAACWARRAEAEPDDAVDHLVRAHAWDRRSPTLARVGDPVANRLWEEGLAARAAGDAETAFRSFSALLRFQPWRSWARRHAEEARDTRLGLLPRGAAASDDAGGPPDGDEGRK